MLFEKEAKQSGFYVVQNNICIKQNASLHQMSSKWETNINYKYMEYLFIYFCLRIKCKARDRNPVLKRYLLFEKIFQYYFGKLCSNSISQV